MGLFDRKTESQQVQVFVLLGGRLYDRFTTRVDVDSDKDLRAMKDREMDRLRIVGNNRNRCVFDVRSRDGRASLVKI